MGKTGLGFLCQPWHYYISGQSGELTESLTSSLISLERLELWDKSQLDIVPCQVLPIARVVVESEVASMRWMWGSLFYSHSKGIDRSEMSNVSKLSKIEKRVQVKARMMEDGPRKRQAIVIGCLWTGKLYLNQSNSSIISINIKYWKYSIW